MLPDYYKILDIGNDASDMEIKKAYRRKVREMHPDVNKSPDAMDKFVLANEAYEILIHHNTRELYEEDFKSWHNPEEYPIYKFWVDAARQRAREHANVPFKDFVKTRFYKSTRTSSYAIFLVGLIFGVLISVTPYWIMTTSDNKFVGVASLFIALPAGIFMIVQALAGFQSLKKFH